MNPYTYAEALAVAEVAAMYQRHDIPCPGAAVDLLLSRIKTLEAAATGNGAESYVEGWMAARWHYGTLDDETDTPHGGECNRVQGPYVCTCDEEGQQSQAIDAYRWFDRQR